MMSVITLQFLFIDALLCAAEVQERLGTRESRFSLLASSWPLRGKQLSRTRVCACGC